MYEIKFNYKAVPAWWLDLTVDCGALQTCFHLIINTHVIMLNKHADTAVLVEPEMFIIGVVF